MHDWRVGLIIDPADADAIQAAAPTILPVEKYAVLHEDPEDGSPGFVELWLDIAADNDYDALASAGDLLNTMREVAGLPSAIAETSGYIGPYLPEALPSRLMGEAKELVETRPEMAVVWAHTSCEVRARHIVLRLLQERGVRRDRLLRLKPWSEQGLDLFTTLTGQRMQDQDWWPAFMSHVTRRNTIVHRGIAVDKPAAHMSLEAAYEFLRYMDSFGTSIRLGALSS